MKASRKRALKADISLLFVAIFWGSNFVIMKEALELITPFRYLGIRFTIAFLILAVIFFRRFFSFHLHHLLIGGLLGLFLFGGFSLQTLGLLHTTPGKSGFITGMSVVMVPFLYYLVTRNYPGWWSFTGGILAISGLYFLSMEGPFQMGYGDLLTLVAALLFAAHIVTLGIYAPKMDTILLATIQLGFCGLFSFILAFFLEKGDTYWGYSPSIWGAIIYAVFFCTILAFVTQTAAQRYTPATHTALILSLEAVFAGLFSYLFWGEIFTLQKLLGALLIFKGILLTELGPHLLARRGSLQEEGI